MQHIQLRRLNPFQGMMIDADLWQDAHEYHRDQVRLHHLALHGWGIVQGLEVSVDGPENTLLIQPGVGIDPAGHFVVVDQAQAYRIETRSPGTVYVVLQFREVPTGPRQSMGNGVSPPTHIVEAYEIQERDRLPGEPYLELARIDFDPARGPIAEPADPRHPGPNELDRGARVETGPAAGPGAAQALGLAGAGDRARRRVQTHETAVLAAAAGGLPGVLELGLGAHGGAGWDQHREGMQFLVREVATSTGAPVRLIDALDLAEAPSADVVYLTGHGPLALAEREVAGLRRLVDQGGLVVADGCAAGPKGEAGARDFDLSFAELANQTGQQLTEVVRGHPLLTTWHLFAQPPSGTRERAQVLEAGGLLYSDADYGCVWRGGSPDQPLPRGTIRDALEFGVNLVLYRPTGQ